jgi:hypothetical protein
VRRPPSSHAGFREQGQRARRSGVAVARRRAAAASTARRAAAAAADHGSVHARICRSQGGRSSGGAPSPHLRQRQRKGRRAGPRRHGRDGTASAASSHAGAPCCGSSPCAWAGRRFGRKVELFGSSPCSASGSESPVPSSSLIRGTGGAGPVTPALASSAGATPPTDQRGRRGGGARGVCGGGRGGSGDPASRGRRRSKRRPRSSSLHRTQARAASSPPLSSPATPSTSCRILGEQGRGRRW